ncbi:DUF4400 domain-containing protein [Alcaligenes faecalis]|uniref:DUF4400 domain-containing protein n=1 Tax=Alcaligenes faecalis TaxID=511 RepID=UPI0024BCB7FB|nr:DUF4400 domain-containing protein [Alcaligenes faecalis]WHQ45843.1 DUF4400 domain-containing protein [Alcaligenes faecalis]
MKKQFWMVALLFVIELVIVLLLVPGDFTYKAINKEAEYVERTLGTESRAWIHETATNWYQSSMIDSGALQAMHNHLIPTEEERLRSRGAQNMGSQLFKWWEGRLDALAKSIYQVFARAALVALWAPYIVVLLIPAAFDGYMTWRIKRTNFAYASPVVHRYSVRVVTSLWFVMLIAFFVPIALDPIFIPLVLMAVCIFMGLALGNLQKRI